MKLITLFIVLSILTTSCNSKEKNTTSTPSHDSTDVKIAVPIGQYVVKVFEDTKGNLWFGTLEKGVAKYDGKQLKYYTTYNGLPSNRVIGIIEDLNGNLWFGTGGGLSKLDGEKFSNFTKEDGLCSNMVSNLFIDSKDNMWIGTWGGVCTYDGKDFNPFPIPYPEINN